MCFGWLHQGRLTTVSIASAASFEGGPLQSVTNCYSLRMVFVASCCPPAGSRISFAAAVVVSQLQFPKNCY